MSRCMSVSYAHCNIISKVLSLQTSGQIWARPQCFDCTPSGALKAYKKSLELYRQLAEEDAPQENNHAPEGQPATVSARLLNNAAVVHMACGKHKEALELVVEASQVSRLIIALISLPQSGVSWATYI